MRLAERELPDFLNDPDGAMDWLAAHPAEAQLLVEDGHKARLAQCRTDVNAFIEYVGRDEKTGERVYQAPIHKSFQELAAVHRRLVLWGHVESGKTWQLTVFRLLWMLGNNPNLRIAVVSRTAALAEKFVGAIKTYVENSNELHEVFPNLRPGRKWTDRAITVTGRVGNPKDYTLQAVGYGSKVIGARLDGAVLDDLLDWSNTRTDEQRRTVHQWHAKEVAGRIAADGWEWVIGNAWHPDDFMHELGRNPAWHAVRFPVLDPATRQPRWPERWPLERIDSWTRENGTAEAARQLHCVARDDATARFKRDWVEGSLRRGEGRSMPHSLKALPLGYRTYTGVDVSTGEGADKSALATICLWPDGTRELLCMESGLWSGPEIVRRIEDAHRRYLSIVAVESNATQKFITQFTGGRAPVRNFHTGANKMDPKFGVESIAVEMEQGQWVIPSSAGRALTEDAESLVRALLYYSPSAHTPDELMALWIAREASCHRVGKVRSGKQTTMRR
jgi:hypothetical protein